jgi:hypothetical protein
MSLSGPPPPPAPQLGRWRGQSQRHNFHPLYLFTDVATPRSFSQAPGDEQAAPEPIGTSVASTG